MPKQITIDYDEYLSMISAIDKLKSTDIIKKVQEVLQSSYTECKLKSKGKTMTRNDAILCEALFIVIKKLAEKFEITIKDV